MLDLALRALARSLPLVALLAPAPAAFAGTLHVDANLATGLNDGSSWSDAFQGPDGLQAALAAAAAGDAIFVAQGTYLPSSTGDRTESFVLPNGVELYGGFLGGEAAPEERPPPGTAPSVLSGDLNGDDPALDDNSFHVVFVLPAVLTGVLDGFTIRSGNANTLAAPPQNVGGGIRCAGNVTVRHCDFRSNRTTFGGAAADVRAGSAPRFLDCTFRDGDGGTYGGGVLVEDAGPVRFERCLFADNSAWRGAALCVLDAPGVVVTDCRLVDNLAANVGGGLYAGPGAGVAVRGSTLVGNVAGSGAGGVRGESADVTVGNCILWNNGASAISGASVTYSIVEGGLAGEGNLAGMPMFVDLAGRDLRLTIDSPAIDAGSNALVPAGVTLDAARNPRFSDELTVPDTGDGAAPLVDMGAFEWQGIPIPSFCDAADGSLAACPCGNPGAPESGCDVQQATGGVELSVLALSTAPQNRATLIGTGFPPSASPTSVVIRAGGLDPNAPVVFGDGLRCVGVPLVRLAATFALFGQARHTFGHGTPAGTGDFYYQLWFRNTPAAFCTPDAFNLSSGRVLTW